MKLYYGPGTCALASHIVLEELGVTYETVKVSTKTHLTEDGADYYAINPKGYVPALDINGELLTEGPAIMQYVADQNPEKNLLPPPGSLARARVQEDLTFIGTEIHKSYSPLFNPATSEETKAQFREKIGKRYDLIEGRLADGRPYLGGERFSPADAYLFVITRWAPAQGVDLHRWPNLMAFQERMLDRPAVQRAMQAEGL